MQYLSEIGIEQGSKQNMSNTIRGVSTLASTMSDEDFIVRHDNLFIELGVEFKNIKVDEKILDVQDVDETHSYDVFVFENFIIRVELIREKIIGIYLTSSVLKTSRGISIGDTISDVFERYGIVDKAGAEFYMYSYRDKILRFYVDENGIIRAIQFEFV